MTLALSDHAPAFTLPGVDGRDHSLDEYRDATALVLVQWCNHCPYVQAWEGRVDAIQRMYDDRGVKVVAINSNNAVTHPEDSFGAMVERAERLRFSFDYLNDQDQSVARALGAERTPEVFVFDGNGRLAYHGAVDDSRDEAAVTENYLRDALDAVLDGSTPAVSETPAVGCTVKWRD